MTTDTHDHSDDVEETAVAPTAPFTSSPLFIVLAVFAIASGVLFVLDHFKFVDATGFRTLLGSVGPLLVAALVAGTIPTRHGSGVRWAFGATAALVLLFLVSMWPQVATEEAVAPVQEQKHLLTWLFGLPLVGAGFILFMPRQATRFLRMLTLGLMAVTFAASLLLLKLPMDRGYHFVENVPWVARFGISYQVGLDGISLWLVLLTTFIVPIATYASFGSVNTRIKDWCFALLLLEAAMIGAFVAFDMFLFYVFWELMLIPMYVMIGVWGGTNRVKSAIKFFLYTMFGSLLMLAAILFMAYTYGRITGHASFDYFEWQRMVIPRNVQLWLFGAFALAFLIKVPMWPMHTWLPDAHTEAPTAGSVILAAVMLKMGTYGYLRFCMGLFPEAASEYGATLAGIAVLGGILYGALCAWKQDDVKRLVAYSSVAHLGYVMLGLFAATQSSIEGSILQMVNHGITTGALFLLVGVIYDRRHTRQLDDFGGLAKVMPTFAALFVVATMASVGLPGTNGFVGEFLIITGTFTTNKLGHVHGVQAAGAAIGVILGALYMLTAVQKMFFGPITHDENKRLKDINGRELVALAPLMVLIFVIGLVPNIFINPMHKAVERLQGEMQSRLDASPAPLFYEGPAKLVARSSDAPPPVATKPTEALAGADKGAP